MTVFEFENLFDQRIAPIQYAESWDNVGLLWGHRSQKVRKILCALDATSVVVEQCIAQQVDLLVVHHPILFVPMQKIVDTHLEGKILLQLAKHGIALYCAHTNLDGVFGGINDYFAGVLDLQDIAPLQALSTTQKIAWDKKGQTGSDGLPNGGIGRIGKCQQPILASEFCKMVGETIGDSNVRLYGVDKTIQTVVAINGAGGGGTSSFLRAKSLKADCVVTAEIKHHIALYAEEMGLNLLEVNHKKSEQIFVPVLAERLQEVVGKEVRVIIDSETDTTKKKWGQNVKSE
ncbi:MAG: Nif3-like dinuclear metal center hexameric protein [Firmicutes bacterium]|nr:Nif3-like dinuclear metal center hexameric protein [Bacillota bacterium]